MSTAPFTKSSSRSQTIEVKKILACKMQAFPHKNDNFGVPNTTGNPNIQQYKHFERLTV